MFVMSKPLFNQYSRWLFTILFEVEKRLNAAGKEMDQRAFGSISERLLDVWLEANRVKCREVPLVNLEQKPWVQEMAAFVARKMKRSAK